MISKQYVMIYNNSGVKMNECVVPTTNSGNGTIHNDNLKWIDIREIMK